MEKITFSLLLLLNIFSVSMTSGLQDIRKYGAKIERERRSGGDEEYHGAMWFGPRLGKRSSRLADDRLTWSRLLEAADALKFYYGQLYSGDEPEISLMKKVQYAPKQGRSSEREKTYEAVNFTPRLGRELGELARVTPSDRDNFRADTEQADARPPLFSPRLGRTTVHFSPRLGREQPYDISTPDEESIRVVRSAPEAKKPTPGL